jgi:hypothetical protein
LISIKEIDYKLKTSAKNQAYISGLQLVDLIAYPSYRYIAEHYKLYEIKQYSFGDRIIDIVKKSIIKVEMG